MTLNERLYLLLLKTCTHANICKHLYIWIDNLLFWHHIGVKLFEKPCTPIVLAKSRYILIYYFTFL